MNKPEKGTGNAFKSKHKVKQNQQITAIAGNKPGESTLVYS